MTVERIRKVVLEETEENARLAEQEWKRGARGGPEPVQRTGGESSPLGFGNRLQVRYVTRASERFEVRNRLYQTCLSCFARQDRSRICDSSDS